MLEAYEAFLRHCARYVIPIYPSPFTHQIHATQATRSVSNSGMTAFTPSMAPRPRIRQIVKVLRVHRFPPLHHINKQQFAPSQC
jgi:hypothetical protein